MTQIALSRIHYPVTTLGPGRRIGIWFQGCSIRCRGCVSLDTWAAGQEMVSVMSVMDALSRYLTEADGLTISGGEPFDQLPALIALLRAWRLHHAGDVLVYSGYSLERLAGELTSLNGLVDGLICDPFEEDAGDHLALRGSANQRLVTLSERGRDLYGPFVRATAPSRAFDLMFDDVAGQVFLVGIPRRHDLMTLRTILARQGHVMATTEDARVEE